jgi:hypothetical protein
MTGKYFAAGWPNGSRPISEERLRRSMHGVALSSTLERLSLLEAGSILWPRFAAGDVECPRPWFRES